MDRSSIALGFLALVQLIAVGCGGRRGDGGGIDAAGPVPGGSGVDGSRRLAELTPAETTTFCDWLIERFGGEGMTLSCVAGPVGAPTLESCRGEIEGASIDCPATVAQAESCLRNPCNRFDSPELCEAIADTRCDPDRCG